MRASAGAPYPLGATVGRRGTNFALFSAHAERIELCLFDATGTREHARVIVPERTGDIWHVHLADVKPGQLYGYRVHGPYQPDEGHRFNPNKLLLDPYAKEIAGAFIQSDLHFGYQLNNARADLSLDRRDNAHAMPKAVVTSSSRSKRKVK